MIILELLKGSIRFHYRILKKDNKIFQNYTYPQTQDLRQQDQQNHIHLHQCLVVVLFDFGMMEPL